MSKIRIFHITDLPQDKIFFDLEKKFRDEFFHCLYKKIGGSTYLSRKLKKIKDEEIRRWKVGIRAIPLWALLELNKLLGKERFSIEKLEKNIIAYKSISKKKIINPNLPIKEDERLVRIVMHIICDGYDGGLTHSPTYVNTEKTLVNIFKDDLKLFGLVPIKERECKYNNKKWKNLYIVEFPRVIAHILRHIYKIRFQSKLSRLPKSFYSLPKEFRYQLIKSFADDESTVGESYITFISSNLKLLKDLKKLIIPTLNLGSNNATKIIYLPGSKSYNFSLKRKSLNIFKLLVDYNHPKKKILLESILKRKSTSGNKYRIGEAQNVILNILLQKPSTVLDMSLKLGIKGKNIRYHLHKLYKMGKVQELKRVDYNSILWGIHNAKEKTIYERT